VKLLKGKRLPSELGLADQRSFWFVHSVDIRASTSYNGMIKMGGMWLPSGSVIARYVMMPDVTEDRALGKGAGLMVVSGPS
jgi:hypothetical protein